jgi:hypothetical protein
MILLIRQTRNAACGLWWRIRLKIYIYIRSQRVWNAGVLIRSQRVWNAGVLTCYTQSTYVIEWNVRLSLTELCLNTTVSVLIKSSSVPEWWPSHPSFVTKAVIQLGSTFRSGWNFNPWLYDTDDGRSLLYVTALNDWKWTRSVHLDIDGESLGPTH